MSLSGATTDVNGGGQTRQGHGRCGEADCLQAGSRFEAKSGWHLFFFYKNTSSCDPSCERNKQHLKSFYASRWVTPMAGSVAAAVSAGDRQPRGTLAQLHQHLLSIKQHSACLVSMSLSAS